MRMSRSSIKYKGRERYKCFKQSMKITIFHYSAVTYYTTIDILTAFYKTNPYVK